MTLVLDASAVLWACGGEGRFTQFGDRLIAPRLMWSEVSSVLRGAVWRGQIGPDHADHNFAQLDAAGVEMLDPGDLREAAWSISTELGWAKTYDAEYLALARIEQAVVVTQDLRLRRGADRLGLVISIEEALENAGG